MSDKTLRSNLSTQALLARFRRGVGTGTGKEFETWMGSEDVDTTSRSGKGFCQFEGRYRHRLSETEEGMFQGATRDFHVTSAREGFPLTIAITKRICAGLGFRHIRSDGNGKPYVPYTTDLLVSRDKAPLFVALSGTTRRKLKKIELYRSLLVEHVYWSLYNVLHLIATESEFTREVLISLGNLRPSSHIAEDGLLAVQKNKNFHAAALAADWSEPLLEVVRAVSSRCKMTSDEGLELFKRLAWAGHLDVDLHLGITPQSRNVLLPPAKS